MNPRAGFIQPTPLAGEPLRPLGYFRRSMVFYEIGGESGIRTHGDLRLAGFQDRFLQPLGHLSIVLQECPSRGHFYTLPQGNSVCQDSFPKVKEKIKKDLQFEAARANLSTLIKISGCSAVGSALDWGSRGREFKSRHSDQLKS